MTLSSGASLRPNATRLDCLARLARCRASLCLAAAAGLMGTVDARADTTVPLTGIGTRVQDGFTIDTHVDSVTYGTPQAVEIPGFGAAFEIRGTVSGVGWGGGGILARAQNAHYAYRIPFVARWGKRGSHRDVVLHHHGGGLNLLPALQRDRALGPQNPDRWIETASDLSVGLPALVNRCVYIATNRRGLRGDGGFSATYLPGEVPALTLAEVTALNATIAAAPGGPFIGHPGIAVGAPVPLVPTSDTATCRDISQALQQVVGGILGKPFRTRIFSGHSSGARLGATLNFGRSPIGALSVRTGGNQVAPYSPASPPIFDGFLLVGFTYETEAARVDTALPISAPVVLIQGRGDERYQHPIRLAYDLLERGVALNGSVWIYEVKGLPHITRDQTAESVLPPNGDAQGGFVSAALGNLVDLLHDGTQPPRSRIAGRIQEGSLVFDQAGGAVSVVAPVLEDPNLDRLDVGPLLVPRAIRLEEMLRWTAVTAVLDHAGDAIVPPTIACRVGGYQIGCFGASLITPFSPTELAALYGNFKGYRVRLQEVVDQLKADRLYDPRIESARTTAERSRPLFEP